MSYSKKGVSLHVKECPEKPVSERAFASGAFQWQPRYSSTITLR